MNVKKKISIVLCIIFIVGIFNLFGVPVETQAAKKATLDQTTVSGKIGEFVRITVENPKRDAIYSATVSSSKIIGLDYSSFQLGGKSDQQTEQVVFGVDLLAKGSASVTIKETLNKKTRDVGTCKITVKEGDGSASYETSLPVLVEEANKAGGFSFEEGQSYGLINIFYDEDLLKKMTFKSSDNSIATVSSSGIVKAKKKGTVIIHINYKAPSGTKKWEVKFNITEKGTTAEAKKLSKLAKDITTYKNTKITKSNCVSVYNKLLKLYEQLGDRIYIDNDYIIHVPLPFSHYTIFDNLEKYLCDKMETQTLTWGYGTSLQILSVSGIAKDKIEVTIPKPITEEYIMYNSILSGIPYKKGNTISYYFYVMDLDGNEDGRTHFAFEAKLKAGSKKFQAVVNRADLLNSNKTYYFEYLSGTNKKLTLQVVPIQLK